VDNKEEFNASAGFHLTNTGIDRNVVLAERICALEKDRIRVANQPQSARLQRTLETLGRERNQLQLILGSAVKAGVTSVAWPIWQTIMTVVFVCAGFAFTRLSFEPFDFNPELLWPCCIGLAFLCAYGTAQFLEKTDLKIIVLGLSIILFVSSIAGLATLASVRGDIFLHQLQVLTDSADTDAPTAPDSALAFYATAGPKMRLFLILLSLSLELAAGLALHEVRQTLKARGLQQPSPESRRLAIVEQAIGQTEAQLAFLRNQPEIFENEYKRNVLIGLLAGAARHARSSGNWPATLAVVAVLGLGTTLQGQAIDLWEGLDLSATSKATGYDGAMAHSQNVEAAARTIATLPSRSRITVAAISDESFARPLVLLIGQVPNGPGKLREYDQVAAARNRLAASMRRIGASVEPRYQSTDILGFLILAGMAFQKTPNMRHVLLIHSDMRQSAAPLDIEHVQIVPLAASLSTVDRQHLFADLSGVEVYVAGAHAVGKDIAYWQSLKDFWSAYFERCHATLRAFSMMRDTPDLTGAH
jgi:hypothetical protein